ncbi:MAG: small multi-drug export protein [Ruminococcaceae bacterium]|nr:small multi-drug export protein [Oscillospiraceae bacterium]
MEGIVESIVEWFSNFPIPKEVVTFIISMLPVLELRGGMVAAALMNIPYFEALGICLAGNILPIPFLLLLINPLFAWMKGTKLLRPIVEKLEKRTLSKKDKLEKGEFWGLLIFVGIPLPGTGAWTGAMLAALLGIKLKKSSVAIGLGVILAAAIMSFITYALPWIIAQF